VKTLFTNVNGKVEKLDDPDPTGGFKIICTLGDWSPYLPLEECVRRLTKQLESSPRRDFYYAIVQE